MGTIIHRAVCVTCWKAEHIDEAVAIAKSLGLSVIGPGEEQVNGYRSFMIEPCGSKLGWEACEAHNARIEKFFEQIGELYVEAVEVVYGYEAEGAYIARENNI